MCKALGSIPRIANKNIFLEKKITYLKHAMQVFGKYIYPSDPH